MRGLAKNPRSPGVGKLQGGGNLWRIRVGDYCIVYENHDTKVLILVLAIAHHEDIYRCRKG